MTVETVQRHLQDAPHCLLLWRKPPPALSGGGVFNDGLRELRIGLTIQVHNTLSARSFFCWETFRGNDLNTIRLRDPGTQRQLGTPAALISGCCSFSHGWRNGLELAEDGNNMPDYFWFPK